MHAVSSIIPDVGLMRESTTTMITTDCILWEMGTPLHDLHSQSQKTIDIKFANCMHQSQLVCPRVTVINAN